MVSIFFFFFNQGGEASSYREREASLPCLLMWDCLLQMKKNPKPPNLGVYKTVKSRYHTHRDLQENL